MRPVRVGPWCLENRFRKLYFSTYHFKRNSIMQLIFICKQVMSFIDSENVRKTGFSSKENLLNIFTLTRSENKELDIWKWKLVELSFNPFQRWCVMWNLLGLSQKKVPNLIAEPYKIYPGFLARHSSISANWMLVFLEGQLNLSNTLQKTWLYPREHFFCLKFWFAPNSLDRGSD